MGIDDEGHPCGFCFVVYHFFYLGFNLTKMREMLSSLSLKLNLMKELLELIGTLDTKKGEKREEAMEDNKEEMISELKKMLNVQKKKQHSKTETGIDSKGQKGTDSKGQKGIDSKGQKDHRGKELEKDRIMETEKEIGIGNTEEEIESTMKDKKLKARKNPYNKMLAIE